jgi:glycosyltransferase involved in cell wall biosynthesis
MEKHNPLNEKLVAILMCTFNGQKYLADQLDSIERQEHQNWILFVSDDGSSDATLTILQSYQARWQHGQLIIRHGPQKGFCQNFLSLACDRSIGADFYAFCDQDDVWLPSKLKVACAKLVGSNSSSGLPELYCGRTFYAKDDLKPFGSSSLFVFPRTFRNALVQSIAGGNTMVFNQGVKQLLEDAGALTVPSHDWWCYLLTTGAGGDVFYDPIPQVLYRQHEGALVGGNRTFFGNVRRAWLLLTGRFRNWNGLNVAALQQSKALLNTVNAETLELFAILRNSNFWNRFRLMEVCGLYRQTRSGTLSLMIAAIFNKI